MEQEGLPGQVPSCGTRQVYVELVHKRVNDYHYDYNITSDSCQ